MANSPIFKNSIGSQFLRLGPEVSGEAISVGDIEVAGAQMRVALGHKHRRVAEDALIEICLERPFWIEKLDRRETRS